MEGHDPPDFGKMMASLFAKLSNPATINSLMSTDDTINSRPVFPASSTAPNVANHSLGGAAETHGISSPILVYDNYPTIQASGVPSQFQEFSAWSHHGQKNNQENTFVHQETRVSYPTIHRIAERTDYPSNINTHPSTMDATNAVKTLVGVG